MLLRETLESRELIADKARDMLAHWVRNVLTKGFKAQVVAISRLAATRYGTALGDARDELVEAAAAYQASGNVADGYDETLLTIAARNPRRRTDRICPRSRPRVRVRSAPSPRREHGERPGPRARDQ